VIAWLDEQDEASLFISVIIHVVALGDAVAPTGSGRQA